MCGISGWIFENEERASAQRPSIDAYLKASLDSMVHRGPDSSGSADLSCGAIGARRLAIIDIEGGDQPIFNEDSRKVAVLNGEIYNFIELRRTLEDRGHRFRTRTDTEVLVHGYEEWGADLPSHLEGMFAFAVWDEDARTLLAARDRLGKKPFFYTTQTGGIRFASEIKALLADGALHPHCDLQSILVLLTLQHLPPPLTAMKEVGQLRPGELLLFSGGRIETRRYWSLSELAANFAESPPVRPAELLERLEEASRIRTRADVEVGVFLSGGIDSSLVAAVLRRCGYDFRTFSVGFADSRFDESPKARIVASHLGSRHTEMIVDSPSPRDIATVIWHLDEPLADSSAIPQYQICKAAASELKVVISGDGGDEFFGGYLKHHQFARLRPLLRLGALVPDAFRKRLHGVSRRIARGLALSRQSEIDAYFDYLSTVPSAERSSVLGEAFSEAIDAKTIASPVSDLLADPIELPPGPGILWRLAVTDGLTELPGDILVKVDRMSMANSLEVRSPFLDHRLVEWALSLPDSIRARRGETKPLLRDAARMLLPPEIAEAPKQGFGVPLSEWMRGELGVIAAEVLLDETTARRGWLKRSYIKDLFAANLAGKNMGPRLWLALVLELWARAYLDSSPPRPPAL